MKTFAIILLTIATLPVFTQLVSVQPVYAAQPPEIPIWQSHAPFRNSERQNTARTNGAVAEELGRFFDNHAHRITRGYSGRGNNIDHESANLLRQYLERGWAAETRAAVDPFSNEFRSWVRDNVTINLVRSTGAGSYGYFHVAGNDIKIAVSDTGRSSFINIVLNEEAHSLGLTGTLADLYVEELTGHSQTAFKNSIFYDTSMLRTLLTQMRGQGREHEFWQAAFGGTFNRLWDSEMGHIISSAALTGAKTADFAALAAKIPQLSERGFRQIDARAFRAAVGTTRADATHTLLDSWRVMTGEQDGNSAQAARTFNRLVNSMNNLAVANELDMWVGDLDSFARWLLPGFGRRFLMADYLDIAA